MSTPESYASIHRNAALLLSGTLLLIAALVGGIAGALQIAANGEELLPMVLGALGVFVGGFLVVMFSSMRRHRWTLQAAAVVIEERPWLRYTGRSRRVEVAFASIVGLASVQNAQHDVVELATRQGQRFRLGPAAAKPADQTLQSAMRAVDRSGLENFAARLQAAMLAAGVVPPAFVPGMGFWNRRIGLCLLVVLLLLSLGFAGGVVWALFAGAMQHRGGQAAAMLVMLPFGVGWMLRRAWQRRRETLRSSAPVRLASPQG